MPHRPPRSLATLAMLASLAACADRTPTAPAIAPDLARYAITASKASVFMSGLNAPRGLGFAPNGALYVAEAGTAAINGPCVTTTRGQHCYSGTGSVSRKWRGEQTRVFSGLPSAYNGTTVDIVGPSDVDFQGNGNGYLTIGWGANPALRQGLGSLGVGFGALHRFNAGGKLDMVADLSAFETASNPAGGPLDSNPFGVLAEGGRQYVADAGANDLLQVIDGVVSLVAFFPPIVAPAGSSGPATAEPVPTRVTRGPDGALYVSTLTGFPFRAGTSVLFRVVPGSAPQVYANDFSFVTDHVWGPDGSLYVLQFPSPAILTATGSLLRVAPGNGARTTIATELPAPTGLAMGPDGALYVSINGRTAGNGQVLRIVP